MGGPRLAPPDPRRSRLADWRSAAKLAGVRPLAWQTTAAGHVTALGRGRRWRYQEIAVLVARQNGKSEILVPRIVMGLASGERIMHTAQDRALPREVFSRIADVVAVHLRPAVRSIRLANGQEKITMRDGGVYRIVAPTRSGARGLPNDLVVIDELREMDTFDFVAAARPTLLTSKHPQVLMLSNAGDDSSVVLNATRERIGHDPDLAWVEWSAHPDRPAWDREGWAEANPGLGKIVQMRDLEVAYRQLPTAIFETEHLCRQVPSMRPKVVPDVAWIRCAVDDVGPAIRPALGVSVDPEGRRASAVLAWITADDAVGLTLAADVTGDPLDVDALARGLAGIVKAQKVAAVAFDPVTDRDLVRTLPNAKAVAGRDFAAASDRFARTIESGRLRHAGAAPVGSDLAFAARRPIPGSGAWAMVRASDDRPITAALAAVRAVWVATGPQHRPLVA